MSTKQRTTVGDNPALESAAERTTFNLIYTRSPMDRSFHSDGLTGPDIDDAFHEGETASGDWSNGGNYDIYEEDYRVPEQVWIERFFTTAIQEAVHEVCEWFRLDEQVLLSPHGDHETDILDRSAELAAQLFSLIPYERLERPHAD